MGLHTHIMVIQRQVIVDTEKADAHRVGEPLWYHLAVIVTLDSEPPFHPDLSILEVIAMMRWCLDSRENEAVLRTM